MQSYQTNFDEQNIYKKISFIEKIFKKNIKIIKVSDEYIELETQINKSYIKFYYEKNKVIYIYINNDTETHFELAMIDKINKINMEIENYENVEDVVYDTINSIIELSNKNKNTKTRIAHEIKKDMTEFKKNIDEHKYNLKKSLIVGKLLSPNSIVEMLGDQLLKIHKNKNYNVELINLKNFIVEMNNFNLNDDKGEKDLKIYLTFNLSDDIIFNSPKITLKSNYILKNNILNVIEKLKPFTDITKWSIKYSISEIVDNIYQMICKYGELDTIAKSELDVILIELEYLLSIKNENISENKLLLEFDEMLANELAGFIERTTKQKYWKSGTGYGHNGLSEWNIDEYANTLKNKKIKINEKINTVINIIKKTQKFEKYEIDKLKTIFKYYILDTELETKIIIDIATIIIDNYDMFNDSVFIETIKSIKDYLLENDIVHEICDKKDDVILVENLNEFQKIFNEYKFRYHNTSFNNFKYSKENIDLTSNQISRLQKEFQIIKKSIVLDKDASIFFTTQKTNIGKMRFMISGPKQTPYENGLFIFDMVIPSDFPAKPPIVHFSNNGNRRFNPNLYDSGKVCLSLLGTWTGDKGESWNINTSTFYQLLISIQSQILIDEPYFNEPGYEKAIGTTEGKQKSLDYNYNVRQYTLDHSMIDLLEKNNYPEFKEVINKYFKYHKDNIINMLTKWLEEMPSIRTLSFHKSYDKFINLINDL